MEGEHVRAGSDSGHCLAESFNLPGEDTDGHRAPVTGTGSPSEVSTELEPNPGSPDPRACPPSTAWDCFTGCLLTAQCSLQTALWCPGVLIIIPVWPCCSGIGSTFCTHFWQGLPVSPRLQGWMPWSPVISKPAVPDHRGDLPR